MSKDIKKALEHCINNECVDCPNKEELGSGDIVCRSRLLPEILEYLSDLQHKLEVAEKALKKACNEIDSEYMYGVYCTEYPQYFKEQAEKEVNGG